MYVIGRVVVVAIASLTLMQLRFASFAEINLESVHDL